MTNEEIAELVVKTSYAMAEYVAALVMTEIPKDKREYVRKKCIELWDETFTLYMKLPTRGEKMGD